MKSKFFQILQPALILSGIALATLLFLLAMQPVAFGAMSSGSYSIPSDAIGIGGQASDSTLYNLDDVLGEQATGESSSALYTLNAGFLSMQQSYLSLSAASDISMSPSINGLTGGIGTGSTIWTVITDNLAGYSMTIRATTNPALKSGANSFADYGPAGANPDYTWLVAGADSEFGFTPEGTDIVQRYKDNGAACNTGSADAADKCWDSFDTTGKTIVQRTTGNHPTGTTTTVKVQAESGPSHVQPNGSYSAVVEVTVLPL